MGDTLATTAVLAVGAGLLLYVDANWGSRTSMERFQRKARVCSIESRQVFYELRAPFFERCMRKVTWTAILNHENQKAQSSR